MKITQSTLGNADKCLLSAQYNIDRPVWFKRVAGAERAVGTGYHAGLELYYAERIAVPELLPNLPDMVAKAIEIFDTSMVTDLYDNEPVDEFKWSEKVPDQATAHAKIIELLTAYVHNQWFWPNEFRVLATEVNVVVETGLPYAKQMKLGADLTLVDPNNWLINVDHKTAGKAWSENKHHPRKNDQSALYTSLARQVFPGYNGYRFVFDIIVSAGPKTPVRFDRRLSDPQLEHEVAVRKKADDFAALYTEVHVNLGRDLPANPASTLCNPKWCDFFEGCPHGRALEN